MTDQQGPATNPEPATTRTLLLAGAVLLVAYGGLNIRAIIAFFSKRSSRYGANMAMMIVLFVCIVVIVQALSVRHSRRFDVTRNKRFSLADQTLNILGSLENDVELYGFFKQASPERDRVQNLFDQYAHTTNRIRYELIDPDRSPTRTSEMDVKTYDTIVIQYGDRREQIASITEEALTNGILKITRDVRKVVCFVIGHGEKDPYSEKPSGYSIMREAIESQNYEVRILSLFDEPVVPEDCQLLVVAGPTQDYFDSEIAKVTGYLTVGKNALFLLDPQRSFPNLETLLVRYRVMLENDVVIDPYSRIFGTEYTVPVVTQYVDHPITRDIDVATFFPMARSVRLAPPDIPGVTAQYLARTGKTAWGETDLEAVQYGEAARGEEDSSGPVSIAMIASKKYQDGMPSEIGADESTSVVFGDSDFADNSAFRVSGNGDLLLNVVNFLAEEEDLIAIRPKPALGDQLLLTAAQGRLIFLISVVLLPLSVLGFGVSVFVNRRKLG